MRYNKEFKFFAEDFWNLFNSQNGKCALTARELTELTTEVELRNPKLTKEQGRAEFDNHYIVDKDVKHLARNISEDDIIMLAIEIVKTRGKEKGYTLRKCKIKGN